MKSLSKNLIIIILIFSFTFCSLSGCLFPAVDAIKNMDTPVANLSKDVYSTYKNENNVLNDVAKNIEAMGGCVYTKEEYENLYNNKGITADFSSAADVEPQRQVITVMSTATGSTEHGNFVKSEPIANAIVRINGVPRYTDRNGQVKVTLDKEYVELIVEKNDYNPYIEIMEVSNTEKVVHLKKESDDIEIFGVMLTEMETLPINLINSSYSILLEELDLYIANMQFLSNVKADTYNLLLENEVIYSSFENIIYDIDFNENMENKTFYAQVEYQGIISEKVKLNLKIKKDLGLENNKETRANSNTMNPFEGVDTRGMLDGVNIDISNLMKLINFKNIFAPSQSFTFNYVFNRRKGTLTLSLGFGWDYQESQKKKEAKRQLENHKKEETQNNEERKIIQKAVNDIKEEYKNNKNIADENKLQEIAERQKNEERKLNNINNVKKSNNSKISNSVNDLNSENDNTNSFIRQSFNKIKDLINQKNGGIFNKENFDKVLSSFKNFAKKVDDNIKFGQFNHGFTFGFEIIAVFEYDYINRVLCSANLTIDGKFSYSFDGVFFVSFVPMFYYVKITVGLKVEITFKDYNGWMSFDKLGESILVSAYAGIQAGVGVGLNNVLSLSLNGEAQYSINGYFLLPKFWENAMDNMGSDFDLGIYLKLKVLFIEEQWGVNRNWNNECKKPEEILNPPKQNKIGINSILSRNFDLSNEVTTNIYDGNKTKIEKVGDNYIATWVDMIFEGDVPKTTLKYSVLKDNVWSTPKTINVKGNAFYHDMYFDGKDLHLTWQNVKEGVNVSSLEQMSANSEIYYAKFNEINNEFANVKQITNDSTLDAAPHFVLQESNSQNLAIAWQKNSLNDIVGLNGKNSIVYSECVGGSWSACQTLYESDNYFSFVDTAYVDGKLTTTCIEDLDNDLFTNDRKIKVIQKSSTEKIVGDKFTEVSNPQFNTVDGKVCLSFYGDGNVHYSENFEQVKTFDIEQGKVNDTYKILENDNKLYIYYYKLSSEGGQQAFATIYDKVSDSWQYDVCLTSSENQVLYPAICVLENGDILTIYNATNEAEEIVSLEYNVKQMRKDFEITYAFYDMDSQVGDTIKLNIGLKNTGDYPIKNVKVSAFGQTDDIVLEKALQIGETIFVEVERVFAINAQGAETIVCQYEDVQKEYLLATRLTDISIEGNVTFDTFKEYYNLKLTNSSDYSSKVYMDVYYKGKIVETIELFLDGNSSLDYTYFNDNFENGNFVYFVIRTDVADKYESDNEISFRINNMAEKKNELQNKYYDILQLVKTF